MDLLIRIQDGAVGRAMRESLLLYPLVEILHILGLALLLGSIVALDLRLLGAGRTLDVAALAGYLLPLAVGGFLLAAPTGALLFTTEAATFVGNPAFQAKLALLALAGINAAVLHRGPWRRLHAWGARPPGSARFAAALSIVLWIGVLICGRLIAYA